MSEPFNPPRISVKTPTCPLCHKKMQRKLDITRGVYIFACYTPLHHPAEIAVSDPFVNRWEEALHKATNGAGIACPMAETTRACKGKMRYFATGTGHMAALCPEPGCGAQMTNGGTRKEGTVENVTPDAPGVVQ